MTSEQPWTAAGRALHKGEMFDLTSEEDRRRLALAIEEEAMLRQLERSIQDEHGRSVTLRRAATPAVASPAPLDFEEMRRGKGWPTPISMRHAADGLDMLAIPRYGDVLRWMADACDGELGQPIAEEPSGDG